MPHQVAHAIKQPLLRATYTSRTPLNAAGCMGDAVGYDEGTLPRSRCRKIIQIGQNGYYKVMARYGVERPPPPISLNERRWLAEQERAEQPDAEQGALFALDDTRKAA